MLLFKNEYHPLDIGSKFSVGPANKKVLKVGLVSLFLERHLAVERGLESTSLLATFLYKSFLAHINILKITGENEGYTDGHGVICTYRNHGCIVIGRREQIS